MAVVHDARRGLAGLSLGTDAYKRNLPMLVLVTAAHPTTPLDLGPALLHRFGSSNDVAYLDRPLAPRQRHLSSPASKALTCHLSTPPSVAIDSPASTSQLTTTTHNAYRAKKPRASRLSICSVSKSKLILRSRTEHRQHEFPEEANRDRRRSLLHTTR